jgi:hypothetical protein
MSSHRCRSCRALVDRRASELGSELACDRCGAPFVGDVDTLARFRFSDVLRIVLRAASGGRWSGPPVAVVAKRDRGVHGTLERLLDAYAPANAQDVVPRRILIDLEAPPEFVDLEVHLSDSRGEPR